MKKVVVSLSIFILIIASCLPVFATKYDSIGMKITLPEEYYDLKAGVDAGDSKIDFYSAMMKTTKDTLANEYLQNGVLYNGINSNLANEIYISESENNVTKSVFHLSLATENQLDDIKEELKDASTAQGLKTDSQEIYTKNDITYIYSIATKTNSAKTGTDTEKKNVTTVYQYYTIVNGIGITISLNSSDSSAKAETLKKMVDSISFDEILEKPTDFELYILIAVTSILVIMVLVLMYMAFFSRKVRERENEYDDADEDESEDSKE